MKRCISRAFLTLLIVVVEISAFAGDNRPYIKVEGALDQEVTTDVGPVFQKLDIDKDGFINNHESEELEGLRAVFHTVDENRDNRIDATELSVFLAPRVQ